ncbi:Ribokinase-like protein [Myriangium duriaei CBS 260.36]|uniref:Ribokinase-like protein n=1 Tax=Myriangium duriaei CBS 260.36 TaxID=1168546 RepID=A0A9P4MGY7_9PEZI|nr:Ribokinase-like protein [Myriangium duriaei CBS 260.36]
MDFLTLGMFIIDDIYPSPSAKNTEPWLGIPGGAGTYSALGARLVSPPPLSRRVGWIVDCGSDFSPVLRATVDSWETGALLRPREGLTTRGWNGYSANEHRDFKYLTPKIRLDENDLTPDLLACKSYHMVCSQQRCIDLVTGIAARRRNAHPDLDYPLFIYEPNPDHALPQQLENTLEAIKHVDVISPNHSELAHLFSREAEVHEDGFKASVVEECTKKLLDAATSGGHELTVVVRAGKEGCYIATNRQKSTRAWLPSFHGLDQSRVVDPTGGGNGFLGGFAVGLVRTGDVIEAAIWGSISASLCIEQVGIPVLEHGEDGNETWNGVNVLQRVNEFRRRIGVYDNTIGAV